MKKSMQILEDFELWLRTRFTNAFWFKGHKFEKAEDEGVMIDGGYFTEEEAKQVFKMLNSKNLFIRLNATLMIWERNSFLLRILIALSIIVLILICIRIRK
ncbi:hypothetical protein DRO35_02865 [Candidatus Bathyarchaeota archaeon]|nr:MAG: hypothetical protein DRO35_02865 [Candidatus Bathyarchaeota archaeon]